MGTVRAYTSYNSPLVGGIPTQLSVENDRLWVGTRNRVCQVDWQALEVPESWNCWQFAAKVIASPQCRIYTRLSFSVGSNTSHHFANRFLR